MLLLSRGGVPKHAVVYLDGIAAGSWTIPKERVSLSSRAAKFYPEFLVIPVGQSVTISNNDRLVHSPFSISAPRTFDFGREASGETHSLTFEKPGVVDVFCNIHETMQAMIVVVPSTYYALLAPDGSFQLSGVPVGHYRLIGYSPEVLQTEQASQPVDVRPHERTTVKLQFGQPASSGEKQK
jgi:plastocyanin